MTTHITSAAQWRQITNASTIVVTDFYADWCGPCKMIAPTFESLATKYAKPNRITFAKVDVDNQREIAQQYGVRAMPTFVILRSGSVIDTIQGANPPALTAAVEKAVKLAGAAAMPGAAFVTPGRTLGGSTASSSAGASTSSATRPLFGQRPAGTPAQGRASAWDLNHIIDRLIVFFGLYFTSLFSLDPYMAAQNSTYNVHTPSAPINITSGAPFGGRTFAPAGGSGGTAPPAAAKPKPTSTFKTLADLGSE